MGQDLLIRSDHWPNLITIQEVVVYKHRSHNMRGDVESFGRFFPGIVREVVPQKVQQIYKRAKKLRRKCTLHFLR